MSIRSFWILLRFQCTWSIELPQDTGQRSKPYPSTSEKQNLTLLFKWSGSVEPAWTERTTNQKCQVEYEISQRYRLRICHKSHLTFAETFNKSIVRQLALITKNPHMTQTKPMTFKGGIYSGKKTEKFHSSSNAPFFRSIWRISILFYPNMK